MTPMRTGSVREGPGRSIVVGTMRCSLLEGRSDFCVGPEEPLVAGRLQAKGDSTAGGPRHLEGSEVPSMGGTLSAIDPLAAYLVKNAGFRVAASKTGDGLLDKVTATGEGTAIAFLNRDDVCPAGRMPAPISTTRTGGGCHRYPAVSLPERAVGGQVRFQAVLEPVLEGISEAPEVDVCEGCCCRVVQCVCTGWQRDVHGTNSDGDVVVIVGMHMTPLNPVGRNRIDDDGETDRWKMRMDDEATLRWDFTNGDAILASYLGLGLAKGSALGLQPPSLSAAMPPALGAMTGGTVEIGEARSSGPGSATGEIDGETWLDTIRRLTKSFKPYPHFGEVQPAQMCLDRPSPRPQSRSRRRGRRANSMGSALNPSLEERRAQAYVSLGKVGLPLRVRCYSQYSKYGGNGKMATLRRVHGLLVGGEMMVDEQGFFFPVGTKPEVEGVRFDSLQGSVGRIFFGDPHVAIMPTRSRRLAAVFAMECTAPTQRVQFCRRRKRRAGGG